MTLTSNTGYNTLLTYTPPDLSPYAVGLNNVDNTSDANKPVSIAQQTALDLKANVAGGSFTGAVVGSAGLVGHVANDAGGLMGAKWDGYYNDNTTLWQSQSLLKYPRKYTGIDLGDEGSNYTYIWWGYVYSTTYQYWQFRTISDDGSHVYVNGALVVNNGGVHGSQTVTSSVLNLAKNTLHRIDIYHGEKDGGAVMTFTWRASTDNSTFTDFAETLTAFRCFNAGPM